jgi:hypothetical protein
MAIRFGPIELRSGDNDADIRTSANASVRFIWGAVAVVPVGVFEC